MDESTKEEVVLTRESIWERRRRRIPTGLGGVVIVRALSYAELSTAMGALLDVASLQDLATGSEAERLEKADRLVKSGKASERFGSIEKVVVLGIVEPKFGTDPAAGPVISDLPLADQVTAFNAILELSGFTKKNGDRVRP